MGILGREESVGGNLSGAVGDEDEQKRRVGRVPRLESGPCVTDSVHSPRQRARGQTDGAEVDIVEEWSTKVVDDAGGRVVVAAAAAADAGVR